MIIGIIGIIMLFVIIYIISILVIIGLELCSKLRVDLSHISMDKRTAIAKGLMILVISSIRPCERNGWLTTGIKKTYSADAVQHGPALGQGELVVGDDE